MSLEMSFLLSAGEHNVEENEHRTCDLELPAGRQFQPLLDVGSSIFKIDGRAGRETYPTLPAKDGAGSDADDQQQHKRDSEHRQEGGEHGG